MSTNRLDDSAPIRCILVATDFSPGVRAALDAAIEIAVVHGASIDLFHAVDPDEEIPAAPADRIDAELAALAGVAREKGVDARGTHRAGTPWDVLVEMERELDVDLVVVGTRGHNPWIRVFVGSMADRMIRVASAPVLAVRPGDRPAVYPVATALVGIDFSEASLHAAAETARLLAASPASSRIVLVHAFHCPADYSIAAGGAYAIPVDVGEREDDARVRLEAIADSLRSESRVVDVLPRYGYAVSAIEDAACELNANLIAVGTHGRSGLRRMFLGSVAERVLHHAACPVLVVRHPDHVVRESEAERAHVVDVHTV